MKWLFLFTTLVVADVEPTTMRNITIIGDSEACAIKPAVKHVKRANEIVNVECKGGSTVQWWNAEDRFKKALDKHPRSDTVIVFLGTNHYHQSKAPPVEPMLAEIRSRGLKCIWVGNTSVKGRRWRINGVMRKAVSETCSYFDTEAAEIPLADGAHPTNAGALKWLKMIWRLV